MIFVLCSVEIVQLLSCVWLCDLMDCSIPVLHHFPEFSQTHVHWVSDAIHPSHALSVSSLPAFNLSLHSGVFQWVGSSHHLAKVLELQLQCQSFQWILKVNFLLDWLIWSPCCPRDSQESSPAPQFESINSLSLSLLYGPTRISVHDYCKRVHLPFPVLNIFATH